MKKDLIKFLKYLLPVGYNGVRLLEGDLCMVLLQILQANLEVKLTGSSDDVLARLLNHALHHGVGLGQSLQS